MSKKSESIELRLPHETKQAFMARCRSRGVTASAELRGFIDAAVGGSKPAKKLRLGFALPAGVLIGAALEAAIAGPTFAHAVTATAYAAMDARHDGKVTFAEFERAGALTVKFGAAAITLSPATRQAVMRDAFDAIDANHDGVISAEEYRRAQR